MPDLLRTHYDNYCQQWLQTLLPWVLYKKVCHLSHQQGTSKSKFICEAVARYVRDIEEGKDQ